MSTPGSTHNHGQGPEPDQPVTSVRRPVNSEDKLAEETTVEVKLDIEHASVKDDPRQWSKTRKVSGLLTGLFACPDDEVLTKYIGQYIIVAMVSAAAMNAGLGASIYNRKLLLECFNRFINVYQPPSPR